MINLKFTTFALGLILSIGQASAQYNSLEDEIEGRNDVIKSLVTESKHVNHENPEKKKAKMVKALRKELKQVEKLTDLEQAAFFADKISNNLDRVQMLAKKNNKDREFQAKVLNQLVSQGENSDPLRDQASELISDVFVQRVLRSAKAELSKHKNYAEMLQEIIKEIENSNDEELIIGDLDTFFIKNYL